MRLYRGLKEPYRAEMVGIGLGRMFGTDFTDEREPDEPHHEQLKAMFDRLKAALHAWGEVMDHLRTSAG